MSGEGGKESKKKEIYSYHTPWTAYSMAWRKKPEGRFQFALGSFIEEYSNQFQLVQLVKDETSGEDKFVKLSEFEHPYPATKVMWAPPKLTLSAGVTDLLATSGDYLRIWNVGSDYTVTMKGVLNNNKHAGKELLLVPSKGTPHLTIILVNRLLCATNQL